MRGEGGHRRTSEVKTTKYQHNIRESCRGHGAAEDSRRDEDSSTPQPGWGEATEEPVIPGAGCGAAAGPGPRVSLRSDCIGEAVREELEHSAL